MVSEPSAEQPQARDVEKERTDAPIRSVPTKNRL